MRTFKPLIVKNKKIKKRWLFVRALWTRIEGLLRREFAMAPANAPCGSPKSAGGATSYATLLFAFFTLWSSFLAWKAIKEQRIELWPIFATMVASLATRHVVNCVSPSRLFTNIFLTFLCVTCSGLPAAWMTYKQWESEGWATLVDHDLLVHKPWQGAHYLLCFHTGFWLYDAFDLLNSSLYIHCPGMLAHHVIVVVAFSSILLSELGLSYLVMFLLCEIHAIFAFSRRLLRMLGMYQNGSLLVKIHWGLHWMAFMTVRLPLHIMITIQLFLNRSKVLLSMRWPLVQLPILVACLLGINSWNVFFGLDLYKAFLKDTMVAKEESLKVA
ncbi:hypothetical protein GOP47_0026605 [Adiantum capillus-veneris]|nr:hypothetical protein GOP47_0026605 [Adiantum capillus-veneris]